MIKLGSQTFTGNGYQTRERYLHITMPWRKTLHWKPSNDSMELRLPMFGVYWHRVPQARCTQARWGWL